MSDLLPLYTEMPSSRSNAPPQEIKNAVFEKFRGKWRQGLEIKGVIRVVRSGTGLRNVIHRNDRRLRQLLYLYRLLPSF